AAPGKPAFQRPSQRSAQPEPVAAPPTRPEPAAPRPAPEPVAEPEGADVASVRRRWAELVAAVRAVNPVAGAMLGPATVAEVDGTSIVLTHPSAPIAGRLTSEPRNAGAITQAFGKVLGGAWQVSVVHGEAGSGPVRPAQVKASRPAPTRPSQQGKAAVEPPQRQAPSGRPPVDDVPPPPEPPDLDEPPLPPEPVDEEEMLAEASLPRDPTAVASTVDPEAAVLQLLTDQLGARPLKAERAKR
ncbi:DNA polymerase III subunit gamma/tau, partial [Umezawaea endophytica]